LKNLFIFILLGFIFSGCSQKVTVKSIKAPKVFDADIKQIKLKKLKYDDIGQTNFIYSKLSNLIFDNKKYFTVVYENDLNTVLKEQRLKDSGIINSDDVFEGFQDVKSTLEGKVSKSKSSRSYLESRTNYDKCVKYKIKDKKKICVQYYKYNINCVRYDFALSTFIKVLKLSNGKTIFSNTYSQKRDFSVCKDSYYQKKDDLTVYSQLASNISSSIIKDLAPFYKNSQVTILDDLDIDLDSKDEETFEASLQLIENSRIDKANILLQRLNQKLNSKSYVVLYNLAITYEALGDTNLAYKLLKKADVLSNFLNKDITNSLRRVKQTLDEVNKVNSIK
jgi:tetratricopeptide (TPR) repeat protein